MGRPKGSKNTTTYSTNRHVTANELREAFWQTFKDLKNGKLEASSANAMTAAGRGILSTVKLELMVADLTKSQPSQNLIGFTNN